MSLLLVNPSKHTTPLPLRILPHVRSSIGHLPPYDHNLDSKKKTVEGHWVGVGIPTKTSGWEKRRQARLSEGTVTENNCRLCNWFMFQLVLGWSLVCSGHVHWVEKIVST